MKYLLERIINSGIKYDYPAYIKRRVRPTNILALLLVSTAAIPFAIISLIYLPKITAIIPGLGVFVGFGAILLNRSGHINLARFLLAIGPLILASSYNFVLTRPGESPIAGVFLLQLSFSLVSFVLYDFREKGNLLFMAGVSILFISGYPWFVKIVTIEADTTIFRFGWVGVVTHTFAVLSGLACMYGLTYINIQSEKRLERFFTLNSDLFVIGNFKGYFTKVNPAWSTLLGYSPQELVSKHFTKFVDPKDHKLSLSNAEQLRRGENVSKLNVTFIAKDDKRKNIQWNLFPDLVDGLIYATGRDITAQLKAEEMLRINERALNSTSTGVVITDCSMPDHPVIYSNPANKSITGYESHEMIGQNCRILQQEDRDQEGLEKLRNAIENQKECKVILRNYRKDGTMFWNELSISPVYDTGGKVTHFVGFQNDITAQVEAEEALKNSREKLQVINDELKDFAHIVSHDLKAPLRAISSLSQWIVQDYGDQLDDEGKTQFDLLTGRVKKMENLIDGILQYSRASNENGEKEYVDLKLIVGEVIDMLSPPDHIKVEIQGDLPVLLVARTRIQQVFQNIISNAIKYNDKKEGLVAVRCQKEEEAYVFSIADNGPGIEKRYFDKVFQIFQTLGVKESYESTGIGLTIVKKTIELHGGEIWLESEIGKGTTFYFSLPCISKPQPVIE